MATIYEQLKSIDTKEDAAEFLYQFANLVIDDFANFHLPEYEKICQKLDEEYRKDY